MIWQPFPLLDKNWQKLFLISFCFVFSVVFLNLFVPFNINLWEDDEGIAQFLRLSKFAAIGILVLAFSQFALRKLFKISSFRFVEFIGWVILEMVLIALVLSAFYLYDGISFWLFFLECIRYAALVVLIPYSVALLIIYVFLLKKDNNANASASLPTDLIGIPDGNNLVKLSVPINNLLYFESADNYVVVQYLDEGKAKKKLIRNTLKNLENTLDNSVIKRCHRSFIVNVKSIKLIEKVSGKFFIHIKNNEKPIPISTNYIPQFKDYIS